MVRAVGALLLVLAIPSLVWRGWYFWTLFAGLTASGLWRLCFPQSSIRAQRRSYPRWVHGCLLVGGAILAVGATAIGRCASPGIALGTVRQDVVAFELRCNL